MTKDEGDTRFVPRDGTTARRQGFSIGYNPFKGGSVNHGLWQRAWRAEDERTSAAERLHPETLRELRQMVKLHGANRLIRAIREITLEPEDNPPSAGPASRAPE